MLMLVLLILYFTPENRQLQLHPEHDIGVRPYAETITMTGVKIKTLITRPEPSRILVHTAEIRGMPVKQASQ